MDVPVSAPAAAEALARGAAALPRPRLRTWVATGTQARDWLHRILTQDVRSLARGRARLACVLDVRGRVLADPVVRAIERDGRDAFALDLDAAAAARAVPHLEKYVIADDVTWTEVPSSHWTLAGPAALDAARGAGLPVPEEGAFLPARFAGADGVVLRRDLPDRPAIHGTLPTVEPGRLLDALRAIPGAVLADEDAWDVARVEGGVPAYGAEIDDRVLPNEAGLSATAISWNKGCYLGQEPVVMAKHRGHPPSLLVRLRVEGDVVPASDCALLDASGGPGGDRRVGRVTTAVRGVRMPGVIALGFVAFASAKPGASFRLESGVAATVDAVLA